MYHPGRLRCGIALMDHPGPGLLGSGGQIGLQLQGVKTGTRQRIQAALMLSDRLQKFCGGLVIEFLQFGLDLGIEEYRVGGRDKYPKFGDLGLIT